MSSFQMTTEGSDLTVEEWIKMSKLVRVLAHDHDTNYIAIEVQIEEGESDNKTIKSGILLLKKPPFEFDEVVTLMKGDEQQFKVKFINDIYHHCMVAAQSACNGMFLLTIIFNNCDLHLLKILI